MIKKILKKFPVLKEMFLYGVIGGTSSLIDALLFILLRKFNLNITLANFISINVGIAISFVLNTFFNFKKKDNIKKRAMSFFGIGYIGLVLSLIIMRVFVTGLGFNEIIVKIISIIVVAIIQYILNKFITYGNKDLLSKSKKVLKNTNYKQVLIYTSFLLLLYLFLPVILSILGFLINIPITRFHFIISIIISIFIVFRIAKRKDFFQEFTISTILSVLILVLAIVITWNMIDYSFDGVNYHLHTVISLINGWNPLKTVLKTGYYADMNANYFAGKGVWLYSSSISKLLNNLNVTKSYIIISSFMTLLLVWYVLLETKILKNMSKMYIFVLSLFIVFNPIITYQFMTNYTDVYMGNLMLILIFSLIYITKINNSKIINIMAMISIIIMGNIKSTGIFFAFMFSALFFVPWLIDYFKTKDIKVLLGKAIPLFVGGILIFIIGINPYFTNIRNGKNMFYPVFGKNKIELVGENCPKQLQDKNNLSQIYYSMVSPVSNSLAKEEYTKKNPFVIKKEELSNNSFDIRLSGLGPLFQLIVYLSIILFIVLLIVYIKNYKKIRKDNKTISIWFYTFISIIIVGLVFPDAWWARYYPLFWILPLILLILSSIILKDKKIVSYISVVILSIMFVNNALLFFATFTNYQGQNDTIHLELENCKNKTCYVSVDKNLFGFTVGEMFKRNNTKIIYKDYYEVDWDYKAYLMATKEKK